MDIGFLEVDIDDAPDVLERVQQSNDFNDLGLDTIDTMIDMGIRPGILVPPGEAVSQMRDRLVAFEQTKRSISVHQDRLKSVSSIITCTDRQVEVVRFLLAYLRRAESLQVFEPGVLVDAYIDYSEIADLDPSFPGGLLLDLDDCYVLVRDYRAKIITLVGCHSCDGIHLHSSASDLNLDCPACGS